MELQLNEIDREQDLIVVSIDGGLDARTADQFGREITALVTAGICRVIIDCSRVTMVTSQGMGALLTLHKRMESRGGDVRLCGVHGVTAQLLQMTHLDRIFGLYPDVGQARLAMRRVDHG